MNRRKLIEFIISFHFLIGVAIGSLASGKWYLYPLGGVCLFLVFVISTYLCCSARNSEKFKDFLGIRSWLEKGKKWCSLCRTMVEKEAWEDGEHRRTCAIEHAEELGQMPHSYGEWGPKKCPRCRVSMKVWPEDGKKFQCANNRMCRHSEGGAVVNRGNPPWMKFSCFPCDINFCSTCVLASQNEETIVDITEDPEHLDDLPYGEQGSNMVPRGPYVGVPSFDRTQDPESIPWVPSAPPDDKKPNNQNMNPPSYQEAITR